MKTFSAYISIIEGSNKNQIINENYLHRWARVFFKGGECSPPPAECFSNVLNNFLHFDFDQELAKFIRHSRLNELLTPS